MVMEVPSAKHRRVSGTSAEALGKSVFHRRDESAAVEENMIGVTCGRLAPVGTPENTVVVVIVVIVMVVVVMVRSHPKLS